MTLTRDNYYTPEANREYMSCSQYQDFLTCEAKALAKIEGRWAEKPSEAFLVGNYFHSYFESPEAHQEFCDQNFDKVFKSKVDRKTGEVIATGKYAPYIKADEMIHVMESDPAMKYYIDLPGENEAILAGKLFGEIPWRIRLDKYFPEKSLIIDYKTCANIQELKYNTERRERETFVEAYGYMMRAAVYCEIERQTSGRDKDATFMLLSLSKQDYPDKEMIVLNHRQRYDYELDQIKKRIFHIRDIKEHRAKPKRCGYCDYCRATKRINRAIPYFQLDPEFREGREDDYAIKDEDFFTAL